MDDIALLELAAALAVRASAVILEIRARGFAVERKEDRSVVTEADHAATGDDVIESCGLARRAIETALRGQPDMTADPRVQNRDRKSVV